ncbi:hypothetical protein O6H91_09G114700 [Diphasiastrum complanatum]|nr:hypothetical protein O6H91_09G114700 [Diphasiastrum complanatum]KAJ7545314.1 hypothetical protein O6H91_09G114700 [Diphasiastrum complanatum]KAJ7545315.1 hypothetical protein O6H91_09G114700 [Diphasiastrum complanatum]KAJ7545319.1 hypothetical protein O6H91_09G114700 [Diphasiastrum complanatum]KAJ7545320.1 hypothetical protein O6H91_09G114700 [Diphasiastrum complanatum]
MYGKCGSLEDAGNVFHLMPHRNVATWNAMMGACAQNGHGEETLNLLNRMHGEGLKPDEITFMCALDACAGLLILEKGKEIHAAIADGGGCKKQVAVGNALVRMYGKCGSLEDARSVFSEMHDRNVASWNVMMSACTQNGQGKEALDLYNQMQQERIKPNEVSFICALDACTSLTALHRGQEIHAAIVNGGYEGHVVVGTTLINMYGKCGRLEDARSIFDRMTNRDVVAWNSMIAACVLNGHVTVALDLFDRMQCDGLAPNQITFVSALDACASQAAHEKGKQIRAAIVKGGYEEQVVVGTALINMFSKLGNLDDARNLFNRMPHRNVVSWNAMIAALARNGHGKEALDLFDTMQHNGLRPDHITFVSALDACAGQAALEKGQEIHSAILDSGYEGQVNVGTALVHMYGKCGNLEEARSVFARMPQRNLVTWNAMIAACSQNGHCKEALELLNQMDCDGIAPNQITYLCALDACASLAVLDEGQKIHASISEDGYEGEVAVANALINMYGKCENLDAARSVFNRMPNRDVVSWNAMITACSQNGHGKVALEYFYQMQLHGISPDRVTYICALDAASSIAALDKGQEIHSAILREGYEGQVIFGNALVSMYGKCGSLEDARIVFNQMPQRDVISWNSMIAVFAQNGHGEEALDAFDQMQRDGFEPDHVTFLSVLAACSHTGRVDDAARFFESMSKDHGVSQKLAHYMCLIDILGRAGHLDDAEKLINNMPFESEARVWLNLLGACRVHGDVERGIRAASHVFAMDPENPTPYVLLSNLIASAGMCNMT